MPKTSKPRLHELFKLAQQQAKDTNIPIGDIAPNLIIKENVSSFWGKCQSKKVNGKLVYNIFISDSLLFAEEKEIMETILHELVHTCPECMNHGPKWKAYANRLNRKYGYNIKRESTSEEKNIDEETIKAHTNYKYEMQCQKCLNVIKLARKTKFVEHPELYRCKCGGSFKRIK